MTQTLRQSIPTWKDVLAVQHAAGESFQWLDDMALAAFEVGYGRLGLHGNLGYEGKQVSIGGCTAPRAISAHGPSILTYHVHSHFERFDSLVAINDDVRDSATAADFEVYADDHLVGICKNVVAGDIPRSITANVSGANELKLIVRSNPRDNCHSVWVNPRLSAAQSHTSGHLIDCLGCARIRYPDVPPVSEVCIATVGSVGFEDWIDDLLGSISANAQCPEAAFVIFFAGHSVKMEQIARRYHATLIAYDPLRPLAAYTKSLLYSAPHVVKAEKFICLDADMLVLGDLQPALSALDALPPGSILACREPKPSKTLSIALKQIYHGESSDHELFFGNSKRPVADYGLIVNDGLIVAKREALLSVDAYLRALPAAAEWIYRDRRYPWRNQFVFNYALAQMGCGVALDSKFNVQLNSQHVSFGDSKGVLTADWNGRKAMVLHFNGSGRRKYPEWRGRYSKIEVPTTQSRRSKDYYSAFIKALRAWGNQPGQCRFAWTFYGTSNGRSAVIRDATLFGLYQTLFSLVRSNGAIRVVETGTARGVSAACLAAAVAERESAQVVTFDRAVLSEREELWALLPQMVRDCIDARQNDSIVGMTECLRKGERFHAALLDSSHHWQHVLAEFELATQLVCPGGLILIHDPLLACETVGKAVQHISEQGYPVVTLWSAEDGEQTDDHLGLAVIENRHRPHPE